MTTPAIQVDRLSKCYRLGVISRQTLQDEIRYWWHKTRGRNPLDHMGRIGPCGAREAGNPAGRTDAARLDPEDPHKFWALEDVSFEVQPGEVLGIIGRNGAGKSTLLKILSRITLPTEGEVVIDGRVGSLLEVGTGFHPELTGRENVYMNGTILGMKKAEIDRKFDEIVAFSEVEQFLDTPVKRYSSGMYVRLAFAVAAHLEPEILLVDEVLAVGDASFQKKCLAKMEDVSHAGRTVLFVSHNMPAVARLCHRAILLDGGRLAAAGPAEAVVGQYLAQAAETGTRFEWAEAQAPGNEFLRLLRVEVVRTDGTPVRLAKVDEEIDIRLVYRVLKPGLSFRCLLWFSAAGTIAFATVEPRETVREAAGIYTSRVTIPAHLLAEQEYTVNVSIFASRGVKAHFVKERDVVSFQVVDPIRGDSARGDYTERLGGLVRPKLDWTTSLEDRGGNS